MSAINNCSILITNETHWLSIVMYIPFQNNMILMTSVMKTLHQTVCKIYDFSKQISLICWSWKYQTFIIWTIVCLYFLLILKLLVTISYVYICQYVLSVIYNTHFTHYIHTIVYVHHTCTCVHTNPYTCKDTYTHMHTHVQCTHIHKLCFTVFHNVYKQSRDMFRQLMCVYSRPKF